MKFLLPVLALCAATPALGEVRATDLLGREITLEGLLQINPDRIIVVGGMGGPEALVQMWCGSPVWQELAAVRNGQVYASVKDIRADSIYGAKTYRDTFGPMLFPERCADA